MPLRLWAETIDRLVINLDNTTVEAYGASCALWLYSSTYVVGRLLNVLIIQNYKCSDCYKV